MADKPVTREEKYLAYLTGDYTGEIPKPITRKEKYLYELCLKGMGGEVSPEEIKSAVNEYLEKNPVKPGATTEQAQQIEQNKTDIASLKAETNSLKEDLTSKADKTSLVKTDRKLDALWKLNQGISYKFEEDNTEAYQKTVPSGAKVANVKSISGKTIVWNQLITNRLTDFTLPDDVTEKGWISNKIVAYDTETKIIENHKYYGNLKTNCPNVRISNSKQNRNCTGIFSAINESTYGTTFQLYATGNITSGSYHIEYMLFDLTQMFGSGNEPSTPEEFEAMFPADYYPYNAGELMSAPVNEVVEQGKNLWDDSKCVHSSIWIKEENHIWKTTKSDATYVYQEFLCEPGYYTLSANLDYAYNDSLKLQMRKAGGSILASGQTTSEKGRYSCNYTVAEKQIIRFLVGGNMSGAITFSNVQIEKSQIASTYSPYHKTSYPIPQAILNLPGYGWSTGNVRNEVNFENKKYIQRVGKYVITGDETFMTAYMPTITFYNERHLAKRSIKAINNQGLSIFSTNEKGDIWQFLISDIGLDEDATVDDIKEWFKVHPVTSYYPMFNEEITNISDLIGDTFQEPLEVEAGGSLTFKNSNGDNYRIPVPSSEEYLVSLAEVAK